MPPNVKLWLSLNDDWLPVLTISTNEISRYTLRPLKWLRFLGFAIYGREGVLSADPDGSQPVEYDTQLAKLQENYYFSSPRTMLLYCSSPLPLTETMVDEPRLADVDDRSSDAHSLDSSRGGFRNELLERDGTCVISGEPPCYCQAAHLLPHAKGDKYIEWFSRYRGNTEEDVMFDIDDPRNGLFLVWAIHYALGNGKSAFIKTPNFSMSAADVPESPHPAPHHTAGRLTLQHFHDPSPVLSFAAPHNKDARLPQDTALHPPSFIFDFLYGAAALQRWGSKESRGKIRERATDQYCTRNLHQKGTAGGSLRERRDRERAERAAKRAARKLEQGEMRSEKQQFWDVMDWMMLLQSQTVGVKARPQNTPHREDLSKDKVESWLRGQGFPA